MGHILQNNLKTRLSHSLLKRSDNSVVFLVSTQYAI